MKIRKSHKIPSRVEWLKGKWSKKVSNAKIKGVKNFETSLEEETSVLKPNLT